MFADIGLADWAFHLATATPQQMGDALMNVHRDYAAAQRKRVQGMHVVEQKTREGFAVVRRAVGLA
jgi:hypothetical protein